MGTILFRFSMLSLIRQSPNPEPKATQSQTLIDDAWNFGSSKSKSRGPLLPASMVGDLLGGFSSPVGRSKMRTDGNMQIVALPEGDSTNHNKSIGSGTLVPAVGASGAIVENKGGESAIKPLDDEDLEVKLRRISEQVPVRISNTSGSSAGSGSGDFHQYRQMRRREQDRVHRMEIDYQKRMAEREFHQRREERLREAEERTAKKRALRQKRKENKKLKKSRLGPAPASALTDGPLHLVQSQPLANNTEENQPSDGNGDSDSDDNELKVEQERLGAPTTQLVTGGTS